MGQARCGPDFDSQFTARHFDRRGGLEPGFGEQFYHGGISKAEPRMGMAITQFVTFMPSQIDHRNAASGPCNARRFAQGQRGVLCEMEHLMQQHGIEMMRGEGQVGEIALLQLDLVRPESLKAGTRNAQHIEVLVERDDVGRMGRKQFGDASGSCADIEQATGWDIAKHFEQRLFAGPFRPVNFTQRVPFIGMAREIAIRLFLACGTNGGEARAIGFGLLGKRRILALAQCQQAGKGISHRRSGRFAQKHRIAFTPPLDKTGIDKPCNMLRDTRLALAEHLRDFANRQFHLRNQPHHAQA